MSLSDRKIHISRDVIFHEAVYPFATLTPEINNSIFPPSQFTSVPDFDAFVPIPDTRPTSDPSSSSITPAASPDPSPSVTPAVSPPNHTPGKPMRAHKLPSYLQDYVLCSPILDCPHHCITTTTNLCLQPPSIPSFCLSSSSQHLLSNLDHTEPQDYEEAITHPGWQEAMSKEFQALFDTHT